MFTNWINYRLAARDPTVSDLYTDLVDGWVLYELLEELSGQSLASLGKMNKGKMRIQRVANMNIPFKYLKDTVKVGEWRGATKQGDGSKAGRGGTLEGTARVSLWPPTSPCAPPYSQTVGTPR